MSVAGEHLPFLKRFTVTICVLIVAMAAFVIWAMFHSATGGAMGPRCSDSEEALSAAALHELNVKIPHVSDVSVWLGSDTQPDVDAVRERVAHFQRWVDGLQDACVKRAYQRWLDFFTRQADEAQAEIRDGRIRKDMEQATAEWALEDDAMEKALKTMPKPPK